MSVGNTTDKKIRTTLDVVKKRVKIVRWAAGKDGVLKVHFAEQNFA